MRLSPRMRSSATGSFTVGNRSRFITPMPCSAEIEPPYFFTTAKTAALTSSQRLRKSCIVGAVRLGDVVVDVAVAEMAEWQRARAGNQRGDRGVGLLDEGGHRRDRHRDVVLDRAAGVALDFAELLADAPERLRLFETVGDGGVADQPAVPRRCASTSSSMPAQPLAPLR